jgi:hypothetical protein
MVVVAFFSAYYSDQFEPDWGGETAMILVYGVAILAGSTWLALRPSRVSLLALAAAITAAVVNIA